MIILSILGFITMVLDIGRGGNSISKIVLKAISILVVIPLSFLITILVNDSDYFYLREYFLIPIVMLFGVYFVFKMITKTFPNSDYFELICKFIVISTLIQCVLSLVMFFIPSVKIYLLSLISADEFAADRVLSISEFRMVGFGVQFFGAGVITSISLIILTYSLLNRGFLKISFSKKLLLYCFIFVVGMAMSRTTIVGLMLSVFMVIYTDIVINKRIYNIFKYCIYLISMLVGFLLFIEVISNSIVTFKDSKMLSFAFESVINLVEKGEASSSSTDAMLEMYEVMPDEITTWLIGDGMFRDSSQQGYYKSVDIGYLRIIFASGLLGLSFFILCHWVILKRLIHNNSTQALGVCLFLLLLVVLLKGIMVLYPIFTLLALSSYYQQHKKQQYTKNERNNFRSSYL